MTDREMYQILEDFANSHTLARDLEVEITEHCKRFTALPDTPAKYEDVVLLSDIVRGAEHFMMWLRREGKARLVKRPSKEAQKPKIQLKACKKGRYAR
jgi:hypothetical protein